MIRTIRSVEEVRSAAARQAAAADLPLHGCPHITTSAMEDIGPVCFRLSGPRFSEKQDSKISQLSRESAI